MDATTFIRENLDIDKLMEYYSFDNVSHEGDMIRSSCRIHGGNNPSAFVINADTGLWYCHTGSCGGGDVFSLVQKLENCTFPESVEKLARLFGINIDDMEINERKDEYIQEVKRWAKTMKQWTEPKEFEAYQISVPTKEVRKFRNFHEDTLKHFNVQFVEEIAFEKKSGGAYFLRDRLVFPIIQHGIQIGASFRKTKAKDYPKWSHQPRSIKTSNLLYNYDAVQGEMQIVVVEGPLDVFAFYEIDIPAVATYGAHITDEQYRLLMKTGADLIFAYDGDDAGREATQKAIKRFRYKANLYGVEFDEGDDPESIPREHLKLKYEGRRKLC